MTTSSSGIFVCAAETRVFVKVVGRGDFQNSQPLRSAGLELIERGYREVHVDLGRCDGMDSTFIGVLAGFGFKLERGRLRLVNVAFHHRELLETLGLDRLLQIESRAPESVREPAESEFRRLPDSSLAASGARGRDDLTALVLEAHEELCRADERNEPKFRNVTRLLRSELDKRRPQGRPR